MNTVAYSVLICNIVDIWSSYDNESKFSGKSNFVIK